MKLQKLDLMNIYDIIFIAVNVKTAQYVYK